MSESSSFPVFLGSSSYSKITTLRRHEFAISSSLLKTWNFYLVVTCLLAYLNENLEMNKVGQTFWSLNKNYKTFSLFWMFHTYSMITAIYKNYPFDTYSVLSKIVLQSLAWLMRYNICLKKERVSVVISTPVGSTFNKYGYFSAKMKY